MNKIIDRFRGVAMIMVVICHYASTFKNLPSVVRIVMGMGQMGCQIFFVMSAFACFLSIDKNRYDCNTFMKRRLAKILPAQLVGILLYQIMMRFGVVTVQTAPLSIAANAFLIHGFLPDLYVMNNVIYGGWFMGTLVVFYLLTVPLHSLNSHLSEKIKYSLDGLVIPTFCLLLNLIIYIPVFYQNLMENNNAWYFYFINQFSSFAFGIALYNQISTRKTSEIKKPLIKGLLAFSLFVLLWLTDAGIVWTVVPYLFSMSIYYLYISLDKTKRKESIPILDTIIGKFSKNSINIYLSHPILVYSTFVTSLQCYSNDVLCYFNNWFHVSWKFSDFSLMLTLLPIVLVSVYLFAVVFGFAVGKISYLGLTLLQKINDGGQNK